MRVSRFRTIDPPLDLIDMLKQATLGRRSVHRSIGMFDGSINLFGDVITTPHVCGGYSTFGPPLINHTISCRGSSSRRGSIQRGTRLGTTKRTVHVPTGTIILVRTRSIIGTSGIRNESGRVSGDGESTLNGTRCRPSVPLTTFHISIWTVPCTRIARMNEESRNV